MPLVTNESEIKQESSFNKLGDGSTITLLSNAYEMKSHFLVKSQKSVLCQGAECILCQKGHKPNREYYYFATVQNEGGSASTGVTKIAASLVYQMNENERKLKSDKRKFSWIAGKTGEGRNTKWSIVRGNDAPKIDEKALEENNKKLVELMDQREAEADTAYQEIIFANEKTLAEEVEARQKQVSE